MATIAIGLLTVLAATVGTITGFGTSTIMIPILVQFMPPVEAIFLVAIIHWFGDIWKVALFRSGVRARLILLFGIPGLLAGFGGASITLEADQAVLLKILGGFIAAYALFLLLQRSFRVPANTATALGGGALSGFFAGVFGIGGAIRSMFLSAFDLPKEVYIATAGAIGLMVDAMRIITYIAGGTTLPRHLWHGLLLFIPLSFLGAGIARKVVGMIPQNRFRLVVGAFLFVIGAKLMLWA
ncbi:MAG: sulfite exporter TauE/SafE family protein [bacterium]|nr:sulfite exporter TauE/SafE family protein [bacterium]